MRKFAVFIFFLWKAYGTFSQSSTVGPNLASSSSSVDLGSSPSSNMSGGTVVETTKTLDVSASLFDNSTPQNTIQPTTTADLQPSQTVNGTISATPQNTIQAKTTADLQPSQTVNGTISATAAPDLNCADIVWEHPSLACNDSKCVKNRMKLLSAMSRCFEEKKENVSLSKMDIPKKIISIGLSLAKARIKTHPDNGSDVNFTEVFFIDNMAMEVGVMDSKIYNGTKRESMKFPKDPSFSGTIALPIGELPSTGKFIYVVAITPNIFRGKNLKKDEIGWEDSDVAGSELFELYVIGDKLFTRKLTPKKRINSNLLSAVFQHEHKEIRGPFKKPALITFKHLDTSEEIVDPVCVFLDGRVWSRDGCSTKSVSHSQTECKSSHLSTFALISKVTEKVDDSDRKLFVTVATVLGSFSLLSLLICAIVAIVINYHQFDKMRIALNIDVSLLLSQLVFFIGLPSGSNLFYSNPKTCEVVNPFLHFFELAALSWLLMEGLYYYSTLKPLFNDKNTVPIVFYFAVGWGIPVAFASACAEFSYPHFGIPERSEFCWMFVRGREAWYFGAPVLILVVLNLITRAFILKEVITWQDDPDDIRLERARDRLVTSIVIMLAIVLTWLFGILAVNNTTDKMYRYFFIMFYTFQGLLVLFFYCIRNQELWQHRKDKKEEEEKEKSKTYDFVYHP